MALFRFRYRFHPILFAALSLVCGCGTGPKSNTEPSSRPSRVLLVSIDGLRPDFYLGGDFEAPTLKSLAASGTIAEAAIPVYPSITYPNHATLITGVTPAKHGILSNTLFSQDRGPTNDWYWDSRALKVPAIWDLAKARGKTTASFGWPVSMNADVTWLVPEIFSASENDHSSNWKLTVDATRPSFMHELVANTTVSRITGDEEYDRWMAEGAAYTFRTHRPDLMLLHFRSVDHAQHETGRDSRETRRAVRYVDGLLKTVLDAAPTDTAVIVVGDHGFYDFTKVIHINSLFARQGWLRSEGGKLLSWKVFAHAGGAQAAVYSRDPSMNKTVLRFLRKYSRGLYQVLDRTALDRLGALPGALCAVDPLEGYSIGTGISGPLVTSLGQTRGQHGYLPSHPKLWTGMIASGPGIPAGGRLSKIQLTDIAPTIASLLGFAIPHAEGRSLITPSH